MTGPDDLRSAQTLTDGELTPSPRTRYEDLTLQLLEGRANATLEQSAEDALLEELDATWAQMSEHDRLAVERAAVAARPRYVLADPFGEPLPEGYRLEQDGGRTRALAPGRPIAWFGAWRRGQRGAAKAVGDAWVHATGARRAPAP